MFAKKNNTQHSSASPSNANKTNTPFIQPKLNKGKAGDKYEVEADKMADKVASQSAMKNQSFIPATNNNLQQKQEESIQEKPLVNSISPVVNLMPEDNLQAKSEDELQSKELENIQSKSNGNDLQTKENKDLQSLNEENIQKKEEENMSASVW